MNFLLDPVYLIWIISRSAVDWERGKFLCDFILSRNFRLNLFLSQTIGVNFVCAFLELFVFFIKLTSLLFYMFVNLYDVSIFGKNELLIHIRSSGQCSGLIYVAFVGYTFALKMFYIVVSYLFCYLWRWADYKVSKSKKYTVF